MLRRRPPGELLYVRAPRMKPRTFPHKPSRKLPLQTLFWLLFDALCPSCPFTAHLCKPTRQGHCLQHYRPADIASTRQQNLTAVMAHRKGVAGQLPLSHLRGCYQVPTIQPPLPMQHCQRPASRAQLQGLHLSILLSGGSGAPHAASAAGPHREPGLHSPSITRCPTPSPGHDDLSAIPAGQRELLAGLWGAGGCGGGDAAPSGWDLQQRPGVDSARAHC
mmetsp:Transcript_15416/g.44137  ORF Transcript_15416/g.44137 Transcript_15416/m.44137 type:complete len:220 (+) Transcript_15416:154-813(+)